MTRTDRRRFPILLASALALLAILGALFLPDRAQAQSIVLVSNIGQSGQTAGFNALVNDYALQFTTGNNADGYNLESVALSLGAYDNATVTVTLHSVSSGNPASASLFTFTNPTSGITADAVNTFTAPSNTTLTGPNTSYFIVVTGAQGTGTPKNLQLGWTQSDDDDDEGADDWAISGDGHGRIKGGTWSTSNFKLQIRVNGSAVSGDPPPSCTLNTGDLWCGVMTVGEFSLGPTQGMGRGYRFGQTGSLTDDEFPFDGDTPYRVQAVYYVSEASSSSLPAGTLALTIDLGIPDGLTLQLGNEQFPFSNASSQDGTSIFWSSSGLSWSVGDQVTLRLSGEAPPTVTVADAAATEGDKVEFVVTLSAVSGRDVDVDYATSETDPQSAVSGTDFTSTSGTLTIAAADNTATGTIQVPTTEDDASESAETFTLTLSNPKNATLGTPSAATGTIENDDVSRLVSNIGQTGADQVTTATIAQRFTIGSSATASTYTLAGVDVVSISTDEFTAQVCTVDSNGYPTSECTDLMPPDTFAAGTMSFAAPENITLSKGTTYTVVLTRVSSRFGFSPTTSDNEDGGKATGWSIRNEYDFVRSGETAWNQHANKSARIAINGTAVSDDCPEGVTTTCEVDVGGSVTGNISSRTDFDGFRVDLEADTRYQIDLEGEDTGRGTLPDPVVELYDGAGSLETDNETSGVGDNARVIYTPTETGTYYVVTGEVDGETGTYTLSVIVLGANGASEADTDFPETTATTGRVEVGASATGNVAGEGDVDFFAVDLDAGKTYQFDLEGADTSRGTMEDPYLALYDGSLTQIENNDDSSANSNSRIVYTATATGTYYLEAAESTGVSTGTYTLSVREVDPPACTLNTGDFWCGVVTVGELKSNADALVGHGFADSAGLSAGSLAGNPDDTMFSVGDNDYTISSAYIQVPTGANPTGTLYVLLSADLTDDDEASLVLTVDDTTLTFAFSDATTGVSTGLYSWGMSGLDWSSATTVTLRLRGATAANNAPAFTSSATFDAAENQTAAGTVAAADSDADDSVTGYAITGGADQALFEIGATAGELTFKTAPNFEDPQDSGTDNTYVVEVTATSGTGTREMTADQTITVTVTDVDTEAPGKPGAPTVSAGSATSLRVNWSAPSNAGPPITGYDVRHRTSSPEGSWTEKNVPSIAAVIENLSENTSYDVQVRATNAEGTGAWSDSGNGTTDAAAILPTLSVADAEGDEDDGVEFTATLTAGVSGKVTATWTASIESGDTAVAADLATTKTGGVEFDADATEATFTVPVNDDTTDEDNETFTVTLSAVSDNAQLATDPTATGTIDDDDPTPTVTVADAAATEGDKVEFVVTLSAVSGRDVDVDYATSETDPQSAVSGTDFTSTSGTLTIAAADNTATGTIQVPTTEDDASESAETFTLTLSNPKNATLGTPSATTGTINDDDGTTLSTDATLSDLSLGTGVTLSPAFASGTTTYTASVANSVDEVTVTPTTNHASATVEILDADDLALTDADSTEDGFQVALSVGSTQLGVLVMAEDGTTTKFYTVNVTRDDFPNDNTTTGEVEVGGTITGNIGTVGDYDRFKVELEAGTRYQLDLEGADTGRGTLADPHLGLYDNIGSNLQGDNGQLGDDNSGVGVNARMIYTPDASGDFYPVVTEINDNLTGTYTLSVIVLGANGVSEADTDFPATTATTGRVDVGASVTGNIENTNDEDWFRVDLEAGKTYQFDLEGVYTSRGMLDDPYLGLFDGSGTYLFDDDDGGTSSNSRITRTPATGGTYYLRAARAGTSGGTYTLSVRDITPCTLDTGDIWCGVVTVGELKNNADALVGHGFADSTGLIAGSLAGNPDDTMFSVGDNDYTISSAYIQVPTGANPTGTLYVLLSADLTDDDKASLLLPVDGTTPPFEFSGALKGTTGLYSWGLSGLTWSAGDTVTIRVRPRTLSVADASDAENDGEVEFTVTLSEAAATAVTATWTASIETGNTAVAADLGATTTGTVTVAIGDTTETFTVPVVNDATDEGDETFTVTLSSPSSNAKLETDPTAKGTIEDDDPTPTVTVGDATADEGDKVEFVVTLSAVSGRDVKVNYATSVAAGDDATSGMDFTAASGTLTIAAADNTATGTIEVQTTEDDASESEETFTLTLSNPSNATLGTKFTATGMIVNLAPPAAPTGLSATAGNRSVALAWNAPASDADITRHEYRYKTDGSYPDTWKKIPYSATGDFNADGFTVTQLDNGTAHTFQLHAVNDDGVSAAVESSAVTPSGSGAVIVSITMRRYDGQDGEPYGVGDEIVFVVEFSRNVANSTNPGNEKVRFDIGSTRKDADYY